MKASPIPKSVSALLAFLLLSTLAYAGTNDDISRYVGDCAKPGPYDPVLGRLDSARSVGSDRYYFLAHGFKGVMLWRVIPGDPSRPAYILKEYYNPKKYALELAAFRGLDGALKSHPDLARKTFAFPSFEDLGPRRKALQLGDVRGKSLTKVLADPRIPEAVKKALRMDYRARAEQLDQLLEKQFGVEGFRLTRFDTLALSWTVPQNGGTETKYNLSTDQVVVSFDEANLLRFTLTLVDPY